MKSQTPHRPTSSALSAAAILASLRANSVTPTAGMSRVRSVQKGLTIKFESSPTQESNKVSIDIVPPTQNKEIKSIEKPSDISLDILKPPLIESKKGILIRKRGEKQSVILVNSFNKPSEEDKRRTSVLKLFNDSNNGIVVDTSVTKEDKDNNKTLQAIKGSHDFIEDSRSSPYLPGYSTDNKTRKKVSFIFNPDSEIPERTGSSRTNRINRNAKSTLYNERAAIIAARNRALQLIAENVKPIPSIVSQGLTFGIGPKSNEKSPIIQQTKEIRLPSRERENIVINQNIQTPNTLNMESQASVESRDTPSVQKQNELSIKKNILVQLPMISTPIIKLSEELMNTSTAGKFPGNSTSIRHEGNSFTFPEAPKGGRGSLAHSNSVNSLAGPKMPNPYTFHVDRLRKKESRTNMSSDSRVRMNTQPDSSASRDFEQGITESKDEHRRKLLSLLRKQQIPL